MSDRKSPIASGDPRLDEQEEQRLREREEAGLEPEKKPGPRQNEGISGPAYATQEEADEKSWVKDGRTRDDVDREAAQIIGDRPETD